MIDGVDGIKYSKFNVECRWYPVLTTATIHTYSSLVGHSYRKCLLYTHSYHRNDVVNTIC